MCARALALHGGEFLSAPACDDRGHYRDQRQDVGRGVHPPDLVGARQARRRASARSASWRRRRDLWLAHDAGPGRRCTACLIELRDDRRDAPRHRGVVARARSASPRRRAHRGRRASPTSRRDHLDYHPTLEAYLRRQAAPVRPSWCSPGGAAVIDADHDHADAVVAAARARGLELLTVGRTGERIRAARHARSTAFAQIMRVAHAGANTRCACRWSAASRSRTRWSPLASRSRPASDRPRCSRRLQSLEGRRAGSNRRRAGTARRSLSITRTSPMRSPRRSRRCGPMPSAGSWSCWLPAATATRASGPMMGAIAAREGRPRHRHRRQSAQRRSGRHPRRDSGRGARRARNRRPRARRSPRRSPNLRRAMCCSIAGKGHETGQIIGDTVLPFSDHEAVARGSCGRRSAGHARPACWSDRGLDERPVDDRRMARPWARRAGDCPTVRGISIDSRTRRAGRSLSSRSRATTATATISLRRRCEPARACAVVSDEQARRPCGRRAAAGRARRAGGARRARARRARARSQREDHRASPARSARPAPRRRCALALAARRRDARVGRILQQSLGRAAVARAHARETRATRVFEIGMNHAGEIAPLTQAGAPARRDHHHDRAGASGILRHRSRRSPMPRRRSFAGIEPGGAAIINRDNPQFERLAAPRRARRRQAHRLLRRARRAPTRGSIKMRAAAGRLHRRGAISSADDVTYKLGAPGRHLVLNSLAVLAAAQLRRRRPRARRARARRPRPAGRARRAHHARRARRRSAADRRKLQRQSGLDARGARAARPGRRSGSAAGASRCSATCWSSAPRAPDLHRGLADADAPTAASISCFAAAR